MTKLNIYRDYLLDRNEVKESEVDAVDQVKAEEVEEKAPKKEAAKNS